MEYSVATAPINVWGIFFSLLFIAVGIFITAAAFNKNVFVSETEKTVDDSQLIGKIFGVAFTGLVVIVFLNACIDTYLCIQAEKNGAFKLVTGEVKIKGRSTKAGGGSVYFWLDKNEYSSHEDQILCDCGFISPIGRKIKLQNAQLVEAKIYKDKIISYKVLN
jgi:hypothetical protein